MPHHAKIKKAVFAPVSLIRSRLVLSDVEVTVGVPGFGISAKPSQQLSPQPTRYGFDHLDEKTPFIESDLETLYRWYGGYQTSRARHDLVTYAEIVMLNRAGKGFRSGIDVTNLTIQASDAAYVIPARLELHRQHAVELFIKLKRLARKRKGRSGYLNDTLIRVADFDSVNQTLSIQLATYFDQVGTNLTMDWASEVIARDLSATIRSAVEPPTNGMLPPLIKSHLANTLGVATFLVTADDKLLVRVRAQEVAIMRGKLHCSASGTAEWRQISSSEVQCQFDMLSECMEEEIARELHTFPDEYELVPLAFARELPRGGKPQLFYLALSKLTEAEIKSRLLEAEERMEFVDWENADLPALCGRWLTSPLKRPAEVAVVKSCFTYEGWMALRLVKNYLSENTVAGTQ